MSAAAIELTPTRSEQEDSPTVLGREKTPGSTAGASTGHRERIEQSWQAAIELLERDLRRRDAAEKTHRAYRVDVGQFARWATSQGLEPGAIGPKMVRRYVAHLSEEGV